MTQYKIMKVGIYFSKIDHKLIKILDEKFDCYVTESISIYRHSPDLSLSFTHETSRLINKTYFEERNPYVILLEKEEGEKLWKEWMRVYENLKKRTIKLSKFYGKIS